MSVKEALEFSKMQHLNAIKAFTLLRFQMQCASKVHPDA